MFLPATLTKIGWGTMNEDGYSHLYRPESFLDMFSNIRNDIAKLSLISLISLLMNLDLFKGSHLLFPSNLHQIIDSL